MLKLYKQTNTKLPFNQSLIKLHASINIPTFTLLDYQNCRIFIKIIKAQHSRQITMEVQRMYQTANFPHPFGFRQYITPHEYADPKRQMIERENQEKRKRQRQGKFKAIVKHKPCFMDQQVKHLKANPGPNKYTVGGNLLQKKRNKSASLNKIDLKASKRTYIDNIQKYQSKKTPGVGKYNIFDEQKKQKILKYKASQKMSHLDDVYALSAQRPGTGHYNPHKSVQRLHMNRTDYKFYQQKHANQQKKLKRCQSSKISPFSYNPVPLDTFAKIASDKTKKMSRWSHGQIQKRKGAIAATKSPGPAEYNLINQWIQSPNKKQPKFGQINLFKTLSKSARSLSVYN